MQQKNIQKTDANPDSPKNRILRLIVGIVIITLGIILFNVTSKLYKKAEEKDAVEKAQKAAEREEMIRELTGE